MVGINKFSDKERRKVRRSFQSEEKSNNKKDPSVRGKKLSRLSFDVEDDGQDYR